MPKRFEVCPKCGKKGFYVSRGFPYFSDGTKVCRYCDYRKLPDRKPKRPKPIKFSKLKRLSFCNSDKLPTTVIRDGRLLHWVGIGWVDEGPASERAKQKYPRVVED